MLPDARTGPAARQHYLAGHLPGTLFVDLGQRCIGPDTPVVVYGDKSGANAARYQGHTEPLDLVAGHIPGAANVPFTSNLNPTGYCLPLAVLGAKYLSILGSCLPGRVAVHCGSGVTACHPLLAFAQAGLAVPRLYIGSRSGWSRPGHAVARET